MTQTIREQLQALVERFQKVKHDATRFEMVSWIEGNIESILATEPPAVTVRAGWVCKDSHGLYFCKARPDWVHYGMWISSTIDQRLFNVGWLINDPWAESHPNGGLECVMEVG